MDIICCGIPAVVNDSENVDGIDGTGIVCNSCGLAIFNPNKDEAIKVFNQRSKKVVNNNNNLVISPNNMGGIFEIRKHEIAEITSPILKGDKSAMERLMTTNTIRYPLSLNSESWNKVWATTQGQESIVRGIEEALIMGAELGKMGDLVPYGDGCQFIPSVEAYEFSLTNGNNAPFESITIECIYENDKIKTGRKDGNFFIDFIEMGIPRGEVIAVACYGTLRKNGLVIGEIYDTKRLLEKAEAHSTSYQYYLRDKKQFEALKSEGKILVENGREFFNKEMFKKGGGSWNKKVFLDELTNPYDGADRPEMLRKSAGKSFFSKFAKVRNSEAAMHEVRNSRDAVNESLKMADSQFEDL